MSNEAAPKLKRTQLDALREVANYEGKNVPYWWRRANMRELALHGYVETWRPPSLVGSKNKLLPYRITPAGLAFVRAIEATEPPQPIE